MLFANAVNLLCAALNIGCSSNSNETAGFQRSKDTVIRITSLVPLPNALNISLSGHSSEKTTQVQQMLKNPKNFGQDGVVRIAGFEFDEIDLRQTKNDEEGKRLVREKLSKTDILHFTPVEVEDFNKFKDELLEFIRNDKLVLLMSISGVRQSDYVELLGYVLDIEPDYSDYMHTTADFQNGPFGSVTTLDRIPGMVKFTERPPGATVILKDKNGDACGVQEKTKIVLGNVFWIMDLFIGHNDSNCQTSPVTTFACNVFASLVDKALKNKKSKVRITSLVPFSDNRNAALSGQYSTGTTQLQRKLENPDNFGVNGIVPVTGFDFKEIDLENIDNDDDGRKIVREMLDQTDILYWSAISNTSYIKFYQELIPYVQQGKVVLLMTVDYEWQNYYSQALGYTLKSTSNRELHPVMGFTGPFGSVNKIHSGENVVKVVDQPKYAKPVLEDGQSEIRGMEEDTKIIIGDSDWLLNTLMNDESDSCNTNDQVRFACNVFASLIKKLRPN